MPSLFQSHLKVLRVGLLINFSMSISCFDSCSGDSERVTAIGSGFELSEKKRVDLSFFVITCSRLKNMLA